MYRTLSVIAIVPVLNEEHKIGDVLRRMPRHIVDEVLVVDDGCTDASPQVAQHLGATVLPIGKTIGVGAAIRAGYQYACKHRYAVAVTVAGNNKDAPEEIPVLLDPIAAGSADFVMGSRFLKRDANFGPMPRYRRIATRIHPILFSLAARRWVTESTNGFRALRTAVLANPEINLSQGWLDEYELEPYLYLRLIQLGYRCAEVPVTKVYPPKQLGQTKMPAVTGWWSILRPLLYVGLGLRK
jgi:dolichol-phosphate mannosyltransferase